MRTPCPPRGQPPRRTLPRRLPLAGGAALLLSVLALPAALPAVLCAEDPPAGPAPAPSTGPALTVPRVGALALDGRLDEAGWGEALRLSADPLDVPPPPPGAERVRLVPDVRLAQSEGALWVGVALAEDPGMGMGLRLLLGPEGIEGSADAVGVVYAPLEVRGLTLTVRGPRGLTRAEYAAEGAADVRRAGAWSLEVRLPLADLALPDPGTRLRAALAVDSRTNGLGAAAPAGALFAAPEAWALLAPGGGAWLGAGDAPADPAAARAALLAADACDLERVGLWRAYQQAQLSNPKDADPATARAYVEQRLLQPLAGMLALRPDLAPYLLWVRGQLLGVLGDVQGAEGAYREALAAMPGCREAAYELYVRLMASAYSEAPPDQPSDYARALARLDGEQPAAANPYQREGLSLGRGLLLYKQGAFAEAAALLEPVARRYPHDAQAVFGLERARAAQAAWAQEELWRRADAQADLPRVRLSTSRGDVTLELYEDDAPNSVRNFVWLVEQGFYDGTAFHRSVPFFVVQGGDPFTKEGADPRYVGAGGPGYAIATEAGTPERRRGAFRGVIAYAIRDRNTEGSQFFLTTGTARHLEGEVSIFGRIVQGQEVAEALVLGDRLLRAQVLRKRSGTTYRPLTLTQEPAPLPVASPPPGGAPPAGGDAGSPDR